MKSNRTWRGPIVVILALFGMATGQPATTVAAADCRALARRVEHGGILWTENAIVVQGTAAPNLADPDASLTVIKRMTQSAATLDAYRKAAGILTGIRVSSQAIASDNPRVATRIEAFVRRARICDAKFYADGGVDMVVMVPLGGVFAMEQLAEAGSRIARAPSDYTGLLVDARHLGFAPAIVPRLLGRDGTVLLDAAVVRAEVIQKRGAVRFMSTLDAAPTDLLGPRPLQVKALSLGNGSPSDLVLDAEAVMVLRAAPAFLGDGRVAIAVAGPVALDCGDISAAVADWHLDWENKLVLARGYGRVDFSRNEDVSVRMRKMERAAEIDAQRKLLETFLAVRIDGRQTVKGLPTVAERVQGSILNAVRCGAKYFKDGSAEVVMAAPLDAMAALSLSLGQTDVPWHLEADDGPTGLIVDAGGLGFEPLLAPRIRSFDGRPCYGPDMVARAYVRHYGVVGYRASLEQANGDKRIGAHPLTVKASHGTPMAPGELRVDGQSARMIKALGTQSAVLSQGRVIIVTEMAGGSSAPMPPAGQNRRVKVGRLNIP